VPTTLRVSVKRLGFIFLGLAVLARICADIGNMINCLSPGMGSGRYVNPMLGLIRVARSLSSFGVLQDCKALSLMVLVTAATASAALQITTTSLPNGTAGTPYSFPLSVTGGSGSYYWYLPSGTPPGMSVSSTGVLSGTPAWTQAPPPISGLTSQSFLFPIEVEDYSNGRVATASLTLTVLPPPQTLQITPSALPVAVFQPFANGSQYPIALTPNGQYYVVKFSATGGTGNYGWNFSGLPSGLNAILNNTFGSTGSQPPCPPGTYTISIWVGDFGPQLANYGEVVGYTSYGYESAQLVVVPFPAVTLLDPVPALLSGAQVTAAKADLATKGRVVMGIAADGVAQVVLRIPVLSDGGTVTAAVFTDQCSNPSMPTITSCAAASTDTNDYGGLFAAGNPPSTSGPLVSGAVATVDPTTGMAFVVYQAPIDFVRPSFSASDSLLASRTVYVALLYSDSSSTEYAIQFLPLTIVRPPVVLVHGLWGSDADWDTFAQLISDPAQRFNIFRVDYATPVSVSASIPTYSSALLAQASGNTLGFSYNATSVLLQINTFLTAFKVGSNVAAVQADIVAHSMGGNIVRTAVLQGAFKSSKDYDAGPVHKLITIGTPHLGTPLASELLSASNACIRNEIFAKHGKLAFSSVALGSPAISVSGAVGDLEGDGNGGHLSPALTGIESSHPGLPTAMIAGEMSITQLDALNCVICNAWFIRNFVCPSDQLAVDLTASAWPGAIGSSSDAIVPQNSQLDGLSVGPGTTLSPAIHSAGMEKLSFAPPTELDSSGPIPTQVLLLLNTTVNNLSVFIKQ
jgi:pimeloyl-ACP methyl ester carboxylesterase